MCEKTVGLARPGARRSIRCTGNFADRGIGAATRGNGCPSEAAGSNATTSVRKISHRRSSRSAS
eukprot:8718560-Alexandrium_andersonii.AAC.1